MKCYYGFAMTPYGVMKIFMYIYIYKRKTKVLYRKDAASENSLILNNTHFHNKFKT